MNKTHCIFNVIILHLIIIILPSCDKSEEINISVKVKGSDSEKVKIEKYDLFDLSSVLIAEKNLDSSRTTKLNFSLPNPTFATAKIGNRVVELYLEPGYDLSFQIDESNEKIFFTGKGAEANNYLTLSSRIFDTYENKERKFFQLSVDEFESRIKSIQESLKDLHTHYCDTTGISKNISHLLLLNNELRITFMKYNFLLIHKSNIDDIHSYDFLKNLSKEIPQEKRILKYNMLSYGLVLHFHLDSEIVNKILAQNKRLLQNEIVLPKLIHDSINNVEYYSPEVREILLAINIERQMNRRGLTPIIDSLFRSFKKNYSSSKYTATIQKSADKWLSIAPGQPAPSFTGLTLDEKQISLSDLKGKIVYIQVWATWCAPCMKEFPYSKNLEKAFDDGNVVFLYVSVDKNKNAWKEKVTQNIDLNGIHINIPGNEFLDPYLIPSIPRYILIDVNGNIIRPVAPKPSSGEVEHVINQLLKDLNA